MFRPPFGPITCPLLKMVWKDDFPAFHRLECVSSLEGKNLTGDFCARSLDLRYLEDP